MWDFIGDRREQIAYNTFQHANLVVQAVVVATLIALALAVVVVAVPRLEPVPNAVSAIGLTIPSFALVGLLLPLLGIGAMTAFWAVAFYAVFPVLQVAQSVKSRDSFGGTAPAQVKKQVRYWKKRLSRG